MLCIPCYRHTSETIRPMRDWNAAYTPPCPSRYLETIRPMRDWNVIRSECGETLAGRNNKTYEGLKYLRHRIQHIRTINETIRPMRDWNFACPQGLYFPIWRNNKTYEGLKCGFRCLARVSGFRNNKTYEGLKSYTRESCEIGAAFETIRPMRDWNFS